MSNKNDSIFQDLTALIPGYGSYREQEARREDDRLTREYLSRRLDELKSVLDRRGAELVAKGNLQAPLAIEKVRARIDHAQSRLKAAVEGYAGWFNEREVDEALLKKIAELDANLVSVVDQLSTHIEQWDGSADLSADAALDAIIDQLHARLDRRHELLRAGS